MKFTVQTILSLPTDGASSHLLTFENKIIILLDCGISHNFDFNKYSRRAHTLKLVSLVLISHSCLQYSGAMPFLIDELGLNPKIFYTTQPIMRYSPLNLHEEIVILRMHQYNKKIFNRMYRLYESINIVKTQQKKAVNVDKSDHKLTHRDSRNQIETPDPKQEIQIEENEKIIGEVEKIIYFTGYSAGGSTGSIAWRISYGIVNILYLVQYNNYSLHHINGLDFNQIKQPIDILITDGYQDIDETKMKRKTLQENLKQIIENFYISNNIIPQKPRPITTQQNQPKLLITCYPNEMLIQLMAVLKKIIQEMQPEGRQKVRVIHLSSRFLQLVKSQIEYFSDFFKQSLQNMEEFYIHSKTVTSRINIVPINALQGLINDAFTPYSNITVYFLGNPINQKIMKIVKEQAYNNLLGYKIMQLQQKIPSSAALPADNSDQNNKMQLQNIHDKDSMSEENQDFTEMNKSQKEQLDELMESQNQFQNFQQLRGKYFSQIGFPQFVKLKKEENHFFDQYGIRHQYQRFQGRQTIEEYNMQVQGIQTTNTLAPKKHSTIQVMNIDFKIPDIDKIRPINYNQIQYLGITPQRTNFTSSMHLMLGLEPKKIIMINMKSDDTLVALYKNSMRNFGSPNTQFFNLADKIAINVQLKNQLISYKLNYIPMPAGTKLQKVKGIIQHKNGILFIHLDCLQQRQCLQFKLHQFYKKLRVHHTETTCKFTLSGIQIDGIKISRNDKQIILQGEYSDEYFKVRKMLYQFLGLL